MGCWRPLRAFKSETEKIRIHRIKIHIRCFNKKSQEKSANIQLGIRTNQLSLPKFLKSGI